MPKTYTIDQADVLIIRKARKENHDKQMDKRLRSVELRGEGLKNEGIAKILETSSDMVSRWVSAYSKGGVEALKEKPRTGRPLNLSFAEESAMLDEFASKAESGQIVEVSDIKAVYQEKVGHPIASGQIYYVLKRHNWRKIKPRSRHPKKASQEVIETSKKLTLESQQFHRDV